MNREIKFRAWDGESFWSSDSFFVSGEGAAYWYGAVDDHFELQRKPNLVISQSTGLKDKNGKEIYEGDVVRALRVKYGRGRRALSNIVGHDEMNLECVFDEERAAFMFRHNAMKWSALFGLEDTYEVIGNIYENPDLLV